MFPHPSSRPHSLTMLLENWAPPNDHLLSPPPLLVDPAFFWRNPREDEALARNPLATPFTSPFGATVAQSVVPADPCPICPPLYIQKLNLPQKQFFFPPSQSLHRHLFPVFLASGYSDDWDLMTHFSGIISSGASGMFFSSGTSLLLSFFSFLLLRRVPYLISLVVDLSLF